MTTLRSTMLRAGAMLLLAVALSACGFQLRGANGQYRMPFQSIYLGVSDTSQLGTEL
jgi:LPS-assembly lipoprotein